VTNTSLAQSYLIKATKRPRILQALLEDGAFSDVVREAEEIIELCLKGVIRQVGVEPPHWHDVSPMPTETSTSSQLRNTCNATPSERLPMPGGSFP